MEGCALCECMCPSLGGCAPVCEGVPSVGGRVPVLEGVSQVWDGVDGFDKYSTVVFLENVL